MTRARRTLGALLHLLVPVFWWPVLFVWEAVYWTAGSVVGLVVPGVRRRLQRELDGER
jgi:hypothetical protein